MTRELDVGQSALLTDIAMCINYYRLFSPGLYCCILVPVQLDEHTRLCPGVMVMVNHGKHKRCDPGPSYDWFRGPPNFVLDVFSGDDRLDYDPDSEIVVTSGATGAFYVVCQALLQPGDEVILFEPYYGYHRNTLEALGVVPRYVTLRGPDFALPLGELEIALSSRTRAIVVNTPGNPSGKVFTRAELEALGAIARERDVFLLTDEVYEHFVYDGREHVSPASLPGLRERTITMNALSKTFAVTGWRIGWVAAPRRFAEAFTHLHDLVYVCAPTPLQLACAIGLERLGPEYYAAISVEYQLKRDQLCEALAAARLAPLRPQGSYFALADISRMPGANGDERALALLRECGVACVPGTAFWRDGDAHQLGRFCFGKTDADLAEACRRLRNLQV